MKQIIQIAILSIFLISCSTSRYSITDQSMTTNSNYWNIPPDLTKIVYAGGDGSSFENAIVILNATTSRDGIAAEYAYIERKHGKKFENWKPIGQSTNMLDGKRYDVVAIQIIPGNKTIQYFFDITEFYGKF